MGPMVVCAFACEDSEQERLKEMGVKDSKLLTAKKRESLFQELSAMGHHALVEVTVSELNARMKARESLNDIEAQAMAQALSAVAKKDAFETAFIDCPDPVLQTYQKRLKRFYRGNGALVCAHKADLLYPVVSAASILAKVTRDARLSEIKEKVGADFGSGYSHDARTVDYLKAHWRDKNHPIHGHVRSEWATAKNLSITQFKLDGFV
ncbi:MAG: ribonuclease HII [Candidatus Micrarchaeota archaeon]|nr:ribonuclease HII [Candidatus Micrarchaeota archaeon]